LVIPIMKPIASVFDLFHIQIGHKTVNRKNMLFMTI